MEVERILEIRYAVDIRSMGDLVRNWATDIERNPDMRLLKYTGLFHIEELNS